MESLFCLRTMRNREPAQSGQRFGCLTTCKIPVAQDLLSSKPQKSVVWLVGEKTERSASSHLEYKPLLFGFASPQLPIGGASQSHPKPTGRFSLKEDDAVVIARRAFLTGDRKIDFV